MFNWEKFKEGKIAVHCDTKEKAIDFLNECERHLIERAKINIRRLDARIFEDGIGYSCGIDYNKLEFDSLEYYEKEYETIIKWNIKENNMEKTFREVIADIKEGEVWEDENFILMLTFDKKIRITHKEGFDDCVAIYIDINSKFKLKREEYTFAEAFKAYEEGKEIESLESRYKYKQNEMFFNSTVGWHDFYDHNGIFSLKEIRGKWYINN